MPKVDNRLVIYEKINKLIIYSKNLLNKYPKSERFDLCTDMNLGSNIAEILKEVYYDKYKNKLF